MTIGGVIVGLAAAYCFYKCFIKGINMKDPMDWIKTLGAWGVCIFGTYYLI